MPKGFTHTSEEIHFEHIITDIAVAVQERGDLFILSEASGRIHVISAVDGAYLYAVGEGSAPETHPALSGGENVTQDLVLKSLLLSSLLIY